MTRGLVPIDVRDIALVHDQLGGRALAPFAREVFLFASHVAGTSHHDLAAIEPRLVVGERISLVRDPANVHDRLAIRVLDARGAELGFVPRDKNEVVARLMDAGKAMFGRIESLRKHGTWLRIGALWYLDDC